MKKLSSVFEWFEMMVLLCFAGEKMREGLEHLRSSRKQCKKIALFMMSRGRRRSAESQVFEFFKNAPKMEIAGFEPVTL